MDLVSKYVFSLHCLLFILLSFENVFQSKQDDLDDSVAYSNKNLIKLLPSLTIVPKFVESSLGDTIQFVCITKDLDPDPEPETIEWTFEHIEYWTQLRREPPKLKQTLPSNVSTSGNILVVWNVTKEHTGIYKCTSRLLEFNLTAQASAELTLMPELELIPRVFVTPELIRLSPESSGTITCYASGYPAPKINWFKLNSGDMATRIIGSQRDRLESSSDLSASTMFENLTIENLSYRDSILYCDDYKDQPEELQPTACKSSVIITAISLLMIEHSSSDHQGHYVCRAKNALGSDESSSLVDVELGEQPHISIPDDIKVQTIELNSSDRKTVTFKCIVDSGKPAPKVRWLRASLQPTNELSTKTISLEPSLYDMSTISSATSNVSIWSDDSEGKVVFLSITTNSLNDQGEYVCLAENQWGRHTALAKLQMKKPISVRIVQTSPHVARINESFHLDCLATGYPLPLDIEWNRNGRGAFFSMISHQQSASNLDDVQERAVLKFDRMSHDEAGEYTCNARDPSNPYLILRDTIMVIVEDTNSNDKSRNVGSSSSLLPRLMIRPTKITATVGSNITLDCLVVSGLQPIVLEWIATPNALDYYNNSFEPSKIRPYFASEYVNQKQIGSRIFQFGSKLRVINVTTAFEGVYQCRGRNKMGVEIAPALIRVVDRVQKSSISTDFAGNHDSQVESKYHQNTTQTKIAKAGSNIELRCQVQGVDQLVTSWSRDGMELPRSSVQIEHNLWIKNVSQSDTGQYVCSARSKSRLPDRLMQARVELIVESENKINGLSNIIAKVVASKSSVQPGDSITLECIIQQHQHQHQHQQQHHETFSRPVKPGGPQLLGSRRDMDDELIGEQMADLERQVVWTNLHTGQSVFQDNVYTQDNLLIIYELRPENSATYRCNYLGLTKHADYKLLVPDSEILAPKLHGLLNRLPQNSVGLNSSQVPHMIVQVTVGDQLEITCSANESISSASIQNYYWTFGNDLVVLPSNQIGEPNKPLIIDTVNTKHADWYQCRDQLDTSSIIVNVLVKVILPVARFSQMPVSFISLPTIENVDQQQLSLELKFLPEKEHGLILFNGQEFQHQRSLKESTDPQSMVSRNMNQSLVSNGDFILLGLNRGHIEFRFELGDGVTLLRSNEPLTLHQWHRVVIERNRQGAVMWVDNQAPVRRNSIGKFFELNLEKSVLYVGGTQFFMNRASNSNIGYDIMSSSNSSRAKSSFGSSRFLGYSKGFEGCIAQLRVSRNEINLMGRYRILSVGIHECNKPECAVGTDYCGSNGFCQVDRTSRVNKSMSVDQFVSPTSDLRCICWSGFEGQRCERTLHEPVKHDIILPSSRDESSLAKYSSLSDGICERTKPCHGNGTIECESISVNSFRCHCRLGFNGKTCSHFASFEGHEDGAFFNEMSYVLFGFTNQFEGSYKSSDKERVSTPTGLVSSQYDSTHKQNGNTYNETLIDMSERQNISFRVKTQSKQGILLYVGQSLNITNQIIDSNSRMRVSRTKSLVANLLARLLNYKASTSSDYLVIALVDGHVELCYDLGSGPGIIRSSERINDSNWHKIQMNRIGMNAEVILDDTHKFIGNSKGKLTALNSKSTFIYLAGFPALAQLQSSAAYSYAYGFSGCIHELYINTIGPINFTRSDSIIRVLETRNVEPCKDISNSSKKVIQYRKPYLPKADSDDTDER